MHMVLLINLSLEFKLLVDIYFILGNIILDVPRYIIIKLIFKIFKLGTKGRLDFE